MYSKDFRERVLAYLAEGHTEKSAVAVFKVSRGTMVAWKKLYRETGSLDRRALNRGHKKLDPQQLVVYVQEHPDAYLKEIGAAFGCTGEAVRQALIKLKITLKKRQSSIKSETKKNGKNSLRSLKKFRIIK